MPKKKEKNLLEEEEESLWRNKSHRISPPAKLGGAMWEKLAVLLMHTHLFWNSFFKYKKKRVIHTHLFWNSVSHRQLIAHLRHDGDEAEIRIALGFGSSVARCTHRLLEVMHDGFAERTLIRRGDVSVKHIIKAARVYVWEGADFTFHPKSERWVMVLIRALLLPLVGRKVKMRPRKLSACGFDRLRVAYTLPWLTLRDARWGVDWEWIAHGAVGTQLCVCALPPRSGVSLALCVDSPRTHLTHPPDDLADLERDCLLSAYDRGLLVVGKVIFECVEDALLNNRALAARELRPCRGRQHKGGPQHFMRAENGPTKYWYLGVRESRFSTLPSGGTYLKKN